MARDCKFKSNCGQSSGRGSESNGANSLWIQGALINWCATGLFFLALRAGMKGSCGDP